jgi:hypothetical protein
VSDPSQSQISARLLRAADRSRTAGKEAQASAAEAAAQQALQAGDVATALEIEDGYFSSEDDPSLGFFGRLRQRFRRAFGSRQDDDGFDTDNDSGNWDNEVAGVAATQSNSADTDSSTDNS